ATSLDTGVRIQRYILQELGETYGLRVLSNRYAAGLVAVVLPFGLLASGEAGRLWALFGAANQTLAGLALVVVTVWLYRSGRSWGYAGVPMLLVIIVSGTALGLNLASYLARGDYVLLAIGATIFALLIWLVVEGWFAVRRRVVPHAAE